jgi:hypothetical protein
MSTAQSTKRVFISHSMKDQELARDIARRLRAAGLDPVDSSSLPRGVEWGKGLLQAILSADAVLFLVTPSALDSPSTVYEAGVAYGADKAIILVVAGVGKRALPEPMARYQAVPYDRLDSAISDLAQRLANGEKDEDE